jgi:hypothetical protein
MDDEGRIMVASDAEVGVIASHAAGIAADTVLGREPSAYPYSLYLIGLAHAWVFKAPFQTIPIATEHLATGAEATEGEFELTEKTAEFLKRLIVQGRDGTTTS